MAGTAKKDSKELSGLTIEDGVDETIDLVPEKITAFVRKHHVLTLATCSDGQPWCANMFYAYDPVDNYFIFTSDDHTRHVTQARMNPQVAASVVLETKIVGRVQGLQITGVLCEAAAEEPEAAQRARKIYLKRFPYAAVADLHLWILKPSQFKLTDNTLGFGKKLYWENK